jgi:hypothetical protein
VSGHGYHWSKCPGGGGFDFTGLLGAAALIGIACAAAEVVLELIWYIVAVAAAALAGLVVAAVVYRRKADTRAAELEATRAERHAAIHAADRRAGLEETRPRAIEHHYHGPSIHIHAGDHEEAASLIRTALTEGKPE